MTIGDGHLGARAGIRLPYRAFLLRCWQEAAGGEPVWRFTLVHLGPGQVQRGFASLEDMAGYLRSELAASHDDSSGSG